MDTVRTCRSWQCTYPGKGLLLGCGLKPGDQLKPPAYPLGTAMHVEAFCILIGQCMLRGMAAPLGLACVLISLLQQGKEGLICCCHGLAPVVVCWHVLTCMYPAGMC